MINDCLKQKYRAFTLVELVIVIAIIAILISLAIPRFLEATQTAKNKEIESNIRTIITSVQVKVSENFAKPSDEMLLKIIESLDINHPEVNYSGEVKDFGIIIRYSSTTHKYTGTLGMSVEPQSEADLNSSANKNDGSALENVWFGYNIGNFR